MVRAMNALKTCKPTRAFGVLRGARFLPAEQC
jgi:hypothetical protein